MAIPNPNIPLPANLDMTVTAYNIPLSAIALWPPPNYTNPEQRFGLAPFAFFLEILTTLVLAGRIWARLTRRAGTFGADDVLVILAWMFGTAFTALSISGVIDGGFDRHVWDVPQTLVAQGGFVSFFSTITCRASTDLIQVAWASEGFFLASSCLTKVSILLFYRRLVNRSYSKRIQNVIYGLIAFTAVYFVVFVFFLIFVCDPVSASWQSLNLGYAVPYKCSSRRFMDTLAGAVSVISDAYVLIIPELVVYRLKMERKKKIVLFALFGSGAM
jgi:hypothetical protein